MPVVRALAALVLLYCAGAGIRTLAGIPREAWWTEAPRSVLAGMALLGIAAPLFALAGLPILGSSAVLLAALAAVALATGHRRNRRTSELALPTTTVFLLMAVPVAFAAVLVGGTPLVYGDEVSVWGFKSASLLETGNLDPTRWALWPVRGPLYPLAIPVAGALTSLGANSLGEFGVRALALTGYACWIATAAELLGLLTRGAPRLALTLGLALLPVVLDESCRFMADLWFAAALAVASTSLLRVRSDAAQSRDATLALLVLPQIRVEGLPIALCLLAAARWVSPLGVPPRAVFRALLLSVLSVAPQVLWLASCGVISLGKVSAAELPLAPAELGSSVWKLLSDFATACQALVNVLFVEGAFPGLNARADPFALLSLQLLLGAGIGGPAFAVDRRAALTLAIALASGQVLSLLLAPEFLRQLDLVVERAAIHLLPAAVLLAVTLRRLDPPPAPP